MQTTFTQAEAQAEVARQQIRWRKIRDGVYWGVAACGLAYTVERSHRESGCTVWELKEHPNEDAAHFESVDVGALNDMKRLAVWEAACHALNQRAVL